METEREADGLLLSSFPSSLVLYVRQRPPSAISTLRNVKTASKRRKGERGREERETYLEEL
jgi:hypothetical protein